MASGNIVWTWSESYKNHFYITYDSQGNPSYVWATTDQRRDSGQFETGNHIHGTDGEYEQLDPSYTVRQDARTFFRRGRLFSVLFSEGMGETARMQDRDCVTVVKYGGKVFTQIRRFVVVGEKKGFSYGCPIYTYKDRATTKPGCRPSEHAVVYYSTLQSPTLLPGETDLVKKPIGVKPSDPNQQPMNTASRIRFGKVYPIDWNVKVKDLGKVIDEDMERLLAYYTKELTG
ncbi:uncharacterized protein BDZ99DRAFT_526598 [Mytilinidion resinicola]|uniref:DUF6590 domain-containing protein n=1 Tax=Mytilinidion resinicola TaxID=574789 RepID=A0A6A6Y5C3_9PEZI|nr:uncharacterized protein BDZ99DRAFT_526598 [Mytilinidion resinicola]KAF2803224.1 hypothetical protein BDZ99DRAFT_526598 [Mytilinidion resinicola]